MTAPGLATASGGRAATVVTAVISALALIAVLCIALATSDKTADNAISESGGGGSAAGSGAVAGPARSMVMGSRPTSWLF